MLLMVPNYSINSAHILKFLEICCYDNVALISILNTNKKVELKTNISKIEISGC